MSEKTQRRSHEYRQGFFGKIMQEKQTDHPTCIASLRTRHPDYVFPPTELQDPIEIERPFEVDVPRVFELNRRRWVG
jgi:hypothetical protein